MATRSMRPLITFALATALGLGSSSVAYAAEGDEVSEGQVRYVSGDEFKLGKTKLVDRWMVIGDPRDDFIREDGMPVDGVNPAADIVEVYLAQGRISKKLLKALQRQFPAGRPGNWLGANAKWKPGQEALFVVAKTAKAATKGNAKNTQIIVGFDGFDAVPAQVGPGAGYFTGLETFSIGGGFGKDGWLSGDTSLADLEQGDFIDYFNSKSRGMGGLGKKSGSLVHITPIPLNADTISVSMRVMADGALAYDAVTMPDGGRHIGLPDKPWGFNVAANIEAASTPPYYCKSVSTLAADETTGLDGAAPPHPFIFKTIYGFNDPVDAVVNEKFLLQLHPVGFEVDPIIVEGQIERMFGLNAAQVSAHVPEGQWVPDAFNVFDESYVLQRDAESPPMFASTFGNGGLLVGPEFEGFVTGDKECGRWHVPGTACDYIDHEAIAAEMGLVGEVAEADQVTADGTLLCAGIDMGSEQPFFIGGIGRDYYTDARLASDVAQHRCPSSEVALGAGGVLFDCTDEGFQSFFWRAAPLESIAIDPLGGLLVSVDLNTTLLGLGNDLDQLRLLELLKPVDAGIAGAVVGFEPPGF